MKTSFRKLMFLTLFATMFTGTGVMAAEMEGIAGKMVDLQADRSTITVKIDTSGLFGPVKRDVSFNLSSDVTWYICLGGSCTEEKGAEGVQMIMGYRPYEPYGLRVEGCDVSMVKSGNEITEIWFEIC